MRRALSLLFAMVMVAMLCACASDPREDTVSSGSEPTSQSSSTPDAGTGSYTEVSENIPDTFSYKTSNDMFEYAVYGRHAEITRYLGDETDVVIPEGLDNRKVTAIAEKAFADRATVLSVHIPATVTTIADKAFYRCYFLETVTGCEGVRFVGESAFAYNAALKSFPWTETLESVGVSAFTWCSSLESIHIKSACDNIENYAFRNCSAAKEIVFDDEVEYIGKEAFMCCSSVTSLKYPYATNEIGEGAFKHCASLTDITFDEQVTVITNRAFQNSHGITEVTIPAHILVVEDYAFGSCRSIKTATFEGMTTNLGNYIFLQVTDLTIEAPEGSTAAFYAGSHKNAFVPLETAE